MKPLVLYHAHCLDGFGAAWAARRSLGKEAQYKAVQYGDKLEESVDDRDVYILDFSFPRAQLIELHERAKSLIVLDHHVTAQKDLEGLDFAVFDLEKSGATLTWQHFFPDEPVPWLLQYVEDKDLWTWKLPQSQEVMAGLQSHPRDDSTWDKLLSKGADSLAREGRPILRYKRRIVHAAAHRTKMIELDGYKIPCVTSCILQSEIGSQLAPKHPFVAITFEVDGKRIWSLRSHEKGGIDVSEIARRHGGGGHRNAAGFTEYLDQ